MLSLTSMEHEILGDSDLETIIYDFACKKMRCHEPFCSWLFFKKHTLTEWRRPGSLQ